jgi:3-oxoadipate enol-lactonase
VTVVLCGSLGATAAMWRPQAGVVASSLVVEHPGHGGAPLLDGFDVDALARRVLDAVEGRFSFVGLSLGGAVGMRVAALAPERLEKLVLACTSSRFGEASQWRERAATVRAEGLEAIVDAVMSRWFTPAYGAVTPWREMFLSVDPEGYARCCEALAGWDGGEDLERIQAQTLVVAGAEDPTSPPEHARGIVARIRDARLAVIDDAAHLANIEGVEEFNRLLEETL